ncbi:MAG: glycosyltransferase [Actinomycetota bacterium]
MGDRRQELERCIASLRVRRPADQIVVVANGSPEPVHVGPDVDIVSLAENVGIPGGRACGLEASDADAVGFLDDDATLQSLPAGLLEDMFTRDPTLAVVAFRIADESGRSIARHIPRIGGRDPGRGGPVATFPGGASVVRRSAYDDVGGFFRDLFYGHEEVELSWRLVDRGWSIAYAPEVVVEHPHTPVGRHERGWMLTGRNRVLVARRSLPWPVAVVHVSVWLLLGVIRASGARRAYVRGWLSGWRVEVARAPISWRAIGRLTKLGRPPIV